jgi:hypothetical protein
MENPCNSCVERYGIKDINSLNNCCYQNCANQMGTMNIDTIINSECGKKCKECVNASKLANGKSLCYWRNIQPPIIWDSHSISNPGDMEATIPKGIFMENFPDLEKFRKQNNYKVPFYIGFILSFVILAFILMIIINVIFGSPKRV